MNRTRTELQARKVTGSLTLEVEEGLAIVKRWQRGQLSTTQACRLMNGWSEGMLRGYAAMYAERLSA